MHWQMSEKDVILKSRISRTYILEVGNESHPLPSFIAAQLLRFKVLKFIHLI